MGRRSEQRIAISFPVIVRGIDPRGSPFSVTTDTHDISFSGASLRGLESVAAPGMKIEIESGGQKAWYRVQWVGANGSSKAGRIGVRCLDQGRYIWGIAPKGWEPDTYEPSMSFDAEPTPAPAAAAFSFWAGRERRQFARHPCRLEAEVTVEGDSTGLPGKVTDISLGGCYVEMLSPLPVDTLVRVSINLEDTTVLHVSASVRSSQMGFGMGVAFTGMGPDEFERLRKIAPPVVPPARHPQPPAKPPPSQPAPARQSGLTPPKINSRSYAAPEFESLDLPAATEALEAIVRLLLRKGLLTRAELSAEFEKLKTAKAS